LEVFCLCSFLLNFGIMSYALKKLPGRWSRFGFIFLLTALLDDITAFINGYGLPPQSLYWSPLLRPFVFLWLNKSAQRFVNLAIPAIWAKHVRDLVLLQLALIGGWAWIGMLFFAHSDEGQAYFPTYTTTMLNLFTLFTTANFPDVMMLSYSRNRWTFFYFCTYLVASLYVLFNVLLAALFSAYKAQVRLKREQLRERTCEELDWIFWLLANERPDATGASGISGDTWTRFWHHYCSGSSKIEATDRADELFQTLGIPEGELMYWSAWRRMGTLLVSNEVNVLWVHPLVPTQRIIILSCIVDVFVLTSFLITVVQTWTFMETAKHAWQDGWHFQLFQFTCCAVHIIEVPARVMVFGCFGFCGKRRYVADLCMATSCLFLEVALYATGPEGSSWMQFFGGTENLYRWLAVLRSARAARVLHRFLNESLMETVFSLLVVFRQVVSALFVVFYIYSTIGVQLFGGSINKDNPALQGSDFSASGTVGYWANNFNDFGSGLVVLFELMVVNNWFIIAGGLAAVSPGSDQVGWAFCISFYVCIHVVILNVLVTSVVECYERLQPMAVNDIEVLHSDGSRSSSWDQLQIENQDEAALLLDERINHVHSFSERIERGNSTFVVSQVDVLADNKDANFRRRFQNVLQQM